ncbi:hypothetical protein SteCoe_27105 [Stentor coeruleus]|uniref:Uncharacterized protein n=1 Tax=Stentor coeruleus TaxID=5963 RepID=A0A1R2BBA8_9CILI|nr:hypothetical protein SteCoe_27105 [Stentor coeruleus]
MKIIVVLVLLGFVSANTSFEMYGIGNVCSSGGGFTISGFNVYPYPPTNCAPQAVSMTGTFTKDECPTEIVINEKYNQKQSYSQIINISGCYNTGDTFTFDFDINAFQCSSGSYIIQVALGKGDADDRLACWEYQYSL